MPPARDLPPDAWIGSRVSIGWLSMRTPAEADDALEEAWQELFREPKWLDWMIEHVKVIYDDEVDLFLWVEDRDDVRARHRRSSLDYYVPVDLFLARPDQVRQTAREIIAGIYAQRAKKAGIAPPPPV